MAVTVVYDKSETMELNATHRLYLKPRARLVITVTLPEEKDPCRPISNWEVVEQLKNLIEPDHFSYIKVTKSTKGFIRFESEVDTKRLAQVFIEKLNGQKVQISSFDEPLCVEISELLNDFPAAHGLQNLLRESNKEEEEITEDESPPPCIHVGGLPSKWFSMWGSTVEKPSEDIVKGVFEKYGPLAHIDIPMLDPYREEAVGIFNHSNPGGLQTFDAFIQYEDKVSCIDAMQSLEGMKLMFAGEDGKSLSCDIKVTLDDTDHFSEEAINRRNAERVKLQELEQQRKQEKQDDEVKRKRKALEQKYRARRRRTKLKRKLQKHKSYKECTVENNNISTDVVEDTQEWEDRKMLLAQRRVESIKLLSLLLDKVTDLVPFRRLNEEPMDCDVTEECSEYSMPSCSIKTKTLSPTEESSTQHESETEEEMERSMSKSYLHRLYKPQIKRKKKLLSLKNNWNCDIDYCTTQEQLEGGEGECFDHQLSKIPCTVLNESCYKRLKVYETDEFINYLLNYYHCPEYARLFLETGDSENKSCCQRVVLCNGDSFKIKLKNTNGHFAEMENLSETDSPTETLDTWKKTIPKSEKHLQETSNHHTFSNKFQENLMESENEQPLLTSRTCRKKNCEKDDPGTWKDGEDTESSGSVHELKDVLEEISSTSEYFSEELSDGKERPVNNRKIPRKPRNVARVKKVKPCCFSDHDRMCCHKDILGHFLQSYSVRKGLKKHSRCKRARLCRKHFHPVYDTETTESDTEVDTEDGLLRKRKKLKKKMHKHRLMEDESRRKDSSVTETSLSDSWGDQHNERVKHIPKRVSHNAAHHRKSKRQPDQWGYYCQGDVLSSSGEDEASSRGQEESSSEQGESSLDYKKPQRRYIPRPTQQTRKVAQHGIRGKGTFNDYLDWEQHFYWG
ncbi:A-kinase anchor protein 17B-like [Pelobates fuscus]|uniref:A-kinase anchor protein 17B-like n=1 Tax=Pelobates fuscus TaxID=191477 RepID=UPI002FE49205